MKEGSAINVDKIIEGEECFHLNFYAECNMARIVENDEDPNDPKVKPSDYVLEVTVHCLDCGKPFLFKNVPGGYNFDSPTVNFEGNKIHLPTKPS